MNKYFVFVCYLYVLLFSAFQTGSPDFENYRDIFFHKYERSVEPLYSFIAWKFSSIISSFQIFVFLQSVVVTILLYIFMRSFSKDQRISMIMYINLYYPLKQLIQIRSLIAVLIVFIGLKFIKSKFKYLSTVVIGCGFHVSVALFAFVPFFQRLRKKTVLLVLLVSLVFIVIPFSLLFSYLPMYNMLPEYYKGWIQAESLLGLTFYHLVRICLTVILFSFVIYEKDDNCYKLFFLMYLMGCVIRFVFARYFFLSSRLSDVFFFAEIVLFSYISLIKKRNVKYSVLVLFIVNSIIMLLLFEKNNAFIKTYTAGW